MASTSVRTAVKKRLVDLLTAVSGPVPVDYGWPGQALEDEHIYLGSTAGSVKIRDFRSGRKARNDTFTQAIYFHAKKPGQNGQEADERVEELYALLENILATNTKLALNGVDLDGVLWAAQLDNETDFPGPMPSADGEGWEAEAVAYVQVKTILT